MKQASAGRMTFLSALHAKLSSQLIREFLREKRNLGNLLAAVAWISALWYSYAKPITSPNLQGAVLCQKAPLPPLSPLWESNHPVGRAGGRGRDGDRGGDPGASEPQLHFNCHSEWHCCGRNLGSRNSPHPFQSFGRLFLEGFLFLKCVVFKLPCRYFAYFQPFLSYFSANHKMPLRGKAASARVGGCKLPCCPLATVSTKSLYLLVRGYLFPRPSLGSRWYFIRLIINRFEFGLLQEMSFCIVFLFLPALFLHLVTEMSFEYLMLSTLPLFL